jgi:hypothetical protein
MPKISNNCFNTPMNSYLSFNYNIYGDPKTPIQNPINRAITIASLFSIRYN